MTRVVPSGRGFNSTRHSYFVVMGPKTTNLDTTVCQPEKPHNLGDGSDGRYRLGHNETLALLELAAFVDPDGTQTKCPRGPREGESRPCDDERGGHVGARVRQVHFDQGRTGWASGRTRLEPRNVRFVFEDQGRLGGTRLGEHVSNQRFQLRGIGGFCFLPPPLLVPRGKPVTHRRSCRRHTCQQHHEAVTAY